MLAIDTAGPVVGVALWDGAETRERTQRVARGSDGLLVPWALELCHEAGITLQELDGIGVARGPGTFTGVRVGLATAVGLCLSVGCPMWPASSLETRRHRAGEGACLTLLDARKGRVYAVGYDDDGALLGGPGDVPPEDALDWMSSRFRATGEGAVVYRSLIEERGGVVVPEADHPGVDALARLASAAISAGEGVAAESVAPVYLREPDARPSGKGRIPRGS